MATIYDISSCGAGGDVPSSSGAGGDDAFSSVDSEVGLTHEEYIQHLTNKYFPPDRPKTGKAESVQVVELKDGDYKPVREFDEVSPSKALATFTMHRPTYVPCERDVNGSKCVVFPVENPFTHPLNPRSWATRLYIAVPSDCVATVAQFRQAREAWLAKQQRA